MLLKLHNNCVYTEFKKICDLPLIRSSLGGAGVNLPTSMKGTFFLFH